MGTIVTTIEVSAGGAVESVGKLADALKTAGAEAEALTKKLQSAFDVPGLSKMTASFDQAAESISKSADSIIAAFGKIADAGKAAGEGLAAAGDASKGFSESATIAADAADKQAAALERQAAAARRSGETIVTAGRKVHESGGFWNFTKNLLIGGGIAAAYGLDKAMKLQAETTRLFTAAGLSGVTPDQVMQAALRIGSQTGFTGQQIAEAMYHPASAGLDWKNVQALTLQSANLANIHAAPLEDTSYAMSSVMKAYNLGVKDIVPTAALLNSVVGQGDMRFRDLNASIKNWAPTGAAMGISIQSMGAALAYLTDRGNRADVASTRLTMGLSMVTAGSKAANTYLHALGLTADSVSIKNESLAAIMNKAGLTTNRIAADLRKPDGIYVALTDLKHAFHAAGLSGDEADQVMAKLFGGGRSDKAIMSLMQNLGGLKQKYDQIGQGVKNYAPDITKEQATAQQQWKDFTAGLSNLGTSFGTTLLPYFTKLAGEANKFIGWLGQGQGRIKDMAVALGGVAALFAGKKLVSGIEAGVRTAETALRGIGRVGAVLKIPGMDKLANLGSKAGLGGAAESLGAAGTSLDGAAGALRGAAEALTAAAGKISALGEAGNLPGVGSTEREVRTAEEAAAGEKLAARESALAREGEAAREPAAVREPVRAPGPVTEKATARESAASRETQQAENAAGTGRAASRVPGFLERYAPWAVPFATKASTFAGRALGVVNPIGDAVSFAMLVKSLGDMIAPKGTKAGDFNQLLQQSQFSAITGASVTGGYLGWINQFLGSGGGAPRAMGRGDWVRSMVSGQATAPAPRPAVSDAAQMAADVASAKAQHGNVVTFKVRPQIEGNVGAELKSKLASITNITAPKVNMSGVTASVSAGMSSAAAAARTGEGQITSAVAQIGAKTRAVTASFAGGMAAAGASLDQGLASGISANEGAVVGAATAVANAAASAMRKALEISSPSKKTVKIGEQTVEGLVISLLGGQAAVDAAANALGKAAVPSDIASIVKATGQITSLITQAVAGKEIPRSEGTFLTRMLQKDQAKLEGLARRRAALEQEITNAQQITQSAIAQGGVLNAVQTVQSGPAAAQSPDEIVSGMQQQAASAKQFAAELAKLQKSGLNATSLAEIAQAGPQAGLATAQGIDAGGKAAIASINQYEGQIIKAGQQLGDIGGPAMYQSGVDIAKDTAKGLKSQLSQVDAAMQAVAKQMLQSLKQVLGGSGAGSAGYQLGQQIAAGIAAGISASASSIENAVAGAVPGGHGKGKAGHHAAARGHVHGGPPAYYGGGAAAGYSAPEGPPPGPPAGYGLPGALPFGGGYHGGQVVHHHYVTNVTQHIQGSVIGSRDLNDAVQEAQLVHGTTNWQQGNRYTGRAA